MLASTSSICSEHWTMKVNPYKTTYKYADSGSLADINPIQKVTVGGDYGVDKIVLKFRKLPLNNDIKCEIDSKYYTDVESQTVDFMGRIIWISCSKMHRIFPGEIQDLIEKIFIIVQRDMPHFSEISEKIKQTLINMGNKRGVTYFRQMDVKPIDQTPEKVVRSLEKKSEKVSEETASLENECRAPSLSASTLSQISMNPTVIVEKAKKEIEITEILVSDKEKIYRINGRIWTQRVIDSPQRDFFNNYSSSVQMGALSNCEYSSPSLNDGLVNYISITTKQIYYPKEDKIVDRKTLTIKSGNEICRLEDPYDIKEKLNILVKGRLLDKEFMDVFF